jgi:competence protein ComEA
MIRLRTSALLLALLASVSLPTMANPAAASSEPVAASVQAPQASAPAAASATDLPARVLINTADAETLARELKGIGAAKAQAIVAYRDANGPFVAVDELLEVRGIGPAILERNRELLSID